ncbi:hypothetical protein CHS0354_017900, partial [Potamilus streckersoni]
PRQTYNVTPAHIHKLQALPSTGDTLPHTRRLPHIPITKDRHAQITTTHRRASHLPRNAEHQTKSKPSTKLQEHYQLLGGNWETASHIDTQQTKASPQHSMIPIL